MFPSILPLLIRPDKRLRKVVLPAPLKTGKENEKLKRKKMKEKEVYLKDQV